MFFGRLNSEHLFLQVDCAQCVDTELRSDPTPTFISTIGLCYECTVAFYVGLLV